MFWNNYVSLCAKQGESPNAVAKSLSIASGTVTNWKNGAIPQNSTLKKISDYFGVTTDYLLNGDTPKPGKYDRLEVSEISFNLGAFGDVQDQEVDEMTELLQELKTRPEMRMLFSLAKGATKEDVELAVAIIQRMRQSGDGE